ncbi:DNA glycosylase AlkZ-like family protein [Cellulomonas palmilytica]|uniref:DNA glycosylase AlkZ-like family protein n=1 Tax=Cellulomonas palmilytica TaxID=2608402 RepID=UPI001F23432C|nr:crosslink repair DNA glycosylase YcaQ family protein [Cellulomonas palmilytica]
MDGLSWASVRAWRLRRHLLDPVAGASVPAVVAALGAVAAQLDARSAELGVRTRCVVSDEGDVARALEAGTVVAAFAFRGAVHLMTPGSAAAHLTIRAASRMWERPGWRTTYGLSPQDWPALREAVRAAAADGPVTQRELATAVAADPRFAHLAETLADPASMLLKPLSWLGDVCLGQPRDGQPTLRSLATNPLWPGLPDLDEAGPAAVEVYLRAYAPASEANLAYWLGEGLGARRTWVGAWLDALGDRVAHVTVEGERRMALREDVDDLREAEPTDAVRLLPRYDQWVMGPGTADPHVVPPALRGAVSRGADLVVAGGALVGTWRRSRDEVSVTLLDDVAAPSRPALADEVARLAALVGAPLHLTP